jgi:hypothetical protein
MPHRPAAVRAQRPGRIILGLVAPNLEDVRLALIQLRANQLLHRPQRLQRRGSLLHNPLANLVQDLLHLLIHLLAIHGYTPVKHKTRKPAPRHQSVVYPLPQNPPLYSGRTPCRPVRVCENKLARCGRVHYSLSIKGLQDKENAHE